MLTDREKKYLKTEISNLRAKMMNAHNVELKGRISAQIQELKDTLEEKKVADNNTVVFIAARVENVRLIDNVELN